MLDSKDMSHYQILSRKLPASQLTNQPTIQKIYGAYPTAKLFQKINQNDNLEIIQHLKWLHCGRTRRRVFMGRYMYILSYGNIAAMHTPSGYIESERTSPTNSLKYPSKL